MNLRVMLPLLTNLPPASARRALRAILAKDAGENATPESLADFKERAAAAFAEDMQPVVTALASALHANDLSALKGLQALLPGLLREVNRAPALADLLAIQLGAAFLEGLGVDPQISQMDADFQNPNPRKSAQSADKKGGAA